MSEQNRTPEESADDAFGINLDYDKLVAIFTRYFKTDQELLRETEKAYNADFSQMTRQAQKVFDHVLPEERMAGIYTFRVVGQAIEEAMRNVKNQAAE